MKGTGTYLERLERRMEKIKNLKATRKRGPWAAKPPKPKKPAKVYVKRGVRRPKKHSNHPLIDEYFPSRKV